MELRLIETGEVVELEYIGMNGIDDARDILGNYDALNYDDENEVYIMSQDSYEWWKNQFSRMEQLDEMMEILKDNDVELDAIYEVDNSDLDGLTKEQIEIAMKLMDQNDLEI